MEPNSLAYKATYGKEDHIFAKSVDIIVAMSILAKGGKVSVLENGDIKFVNPDYEHKSSPVSHVVINIEEIKVLMRDALQDATENRRLKKDLANTKSFLKRAIDTLNLFREFTIKNATQWALGSNHHHPMWLAISTLFDSYETEYAAEIEDIKNGPSWRFIQPQNTQTLDYLRAHVPTLKKYDA